MVTVFQILVEIPKDLDTTSIGSHSYPCQGSAWSLNLTKYLFYHDFHLPPPLCIPPPYSLLSAPFLFPILPLPLLLLLLIFILFCICQEWK